MHTKFQLSGSITSFILQILGWSMDALGISSMFGVQIPFGLIGLCGSLIFAGFMLWMVYEGKMELQRVKDARPSIEVKPEKRLISGGHINYLRIRNNGAEGTFRAQIELSSNDPSVDHLPRYNGYWEYGNKAETKILKGQDDLLKIAASTSLPPNYNVIRLAIFFFDTKANCTSSVSVSSHFVGATVQNEDKSSTKSMPKLDYKLSITITSSPELREGIFHKDYVLNVDDLREIN